MIAHLSFYHSSPPPRWVGEMLIGFAYWVVFLLVLEPGNIMRAHNAGRELLIERETLRICAAASLGAMATPAALWLSQRFFPAKSVPSWRVLVLLGGMIGLTLAMILASCFLAAWFFDRTWLPTIKDIVSVLTGNGLLVLFALLAFGALQQALRRNSEAEISTSDTFLRHVTVKAQGRQFRLELANIERIETQGNYLAFYIEGATHLVRGTMADMTARLDPARFVRIHRRHIIAAEQITHVESFENGDGIAHLKDGSELKISRNYRKALLKVWA